MPVRGWRGFAMPVSRRKPWVDDNRKLKKPRRGGRQSLAAYVRSTLRADMHSDEGFFRPSGAWLTLCARHPTACAVGCILAPLRGCLRLRGIGFAAALGFAALASRHSGRHQRFSRCQASLYFSYFAFLEFGVRRTPGWLWVDSMGRMYQVLVGIT